MRKLGRRAREEGEEKKAVSGGNEGGEGERKVDERKECRISPREVMGRSIRGGGGGEEE